MNLSSFRRIINDLNKFRLYRSATTSLDVARCIINIFKNERKLSYSEILCLNDDNTSNFDLEKLRRIYRTLIMVIHPDRNIIFCSNEDVKIFSDAFCYVNTAYEHMKGEVGEDNNMI